MLYQRGRQFRRRNPTDHRFLSGIGDPFDAVSEFRIPCFLALFFGKIRRKRSARLPSGRSTLKGILVWSRLEAGKSGYDRAMDNSLLLRSLTAGKIENPKGENSSCY
jgi:hypothetical protein